MKICIDICGTIADVRQSIVDIAYGGIDPSPDEYYLPIMGGWDGDLIYPIFREAKPIEGARESLYTLIEMGHELVYLTARPKIAEEVTLEWLKKYDFPNIPLHMHKDKLSFMIHHQYDLLVDDSPNEIMSVTGIKEFITHKRRYNKHLPNRYTWDEIIPLLRSEIVWK